MYRPLQYSLNKRTMASLYLSTYTVNLAVVYVPVSKCWKSSHYRKFSKSIVPPETFFRAFPKTGIG